MARPPQGLYQEDFNPVGWIGDYAVLLTAQGATTGKTGGKTGLIQITHVEPIFLMGQRGVIIIWLDNGAAPAGYLSDTNVVVGHIAAPSGGVPGVITVPQVAFLQFKTGEFAVVRLRFKVSGITGNLADYDYGIFNPIGVQRGAFLHASSYINPIGQGQDPGDAGTLPAQGATVGLPATVADHPWRLAARTEQVLLEDGSLRIDIRNNGAAITAAGVIGLEATGHVFSFEPADFDGEPQRILSNVTVPLPPGVAPTDVLRLPVGNINPG
jgi:hypothetical protein